MAAKPIQDAGDWRGSKNVAAVCWVPSAWLAMGLAYVAVTNTAAILLRDQGLTTSQAILTASLLGLPYVLKPLYAPAIELNRSKRYFVVISELGLFCAFALGGLMLGFAGKAPMGLVAVFAVVAFLGSIQDIACEGLFLTALDRARQAVFTGVQSIAWNGAALIGGGALIAVSGWAGKAEANSRGWALALAGCAFWYLIAAVWHRAVMPVGASVSPVDFPRERAVRVLLSFFRRAHFWPSIAVCLSFPVSAGLIDKIEPFFLIDAPGRGGLGLDRETIGGLYATAGFGGLTLGAALGGLTLWRRGLPRSMQTMAAAAVAPALIYLTLSLLPAVPQPVLVSGLLAARAFLAFAMVGYVVFLQRALAPGPYPTSHYNLASGAKALVMVLTGVMSGPLQHLLGYRGVFAVALACGSPLIVLCRQNRMAAVTD